jgi:hypothetical protein
LIGKWILGWARFEVGEALEEGGGFAGGFAGAALVVAGFDGVGLEGGVEFLVVVGGEGGTEGFDGEWEVVEGQEARAAGDGVFKVVEASGDVGVGHPEGELFEGGVVDVGDVAERNSGVDEVVEDLVGVGGVEHVVPPLVLAAFAFLRAGREVVEEGMWIWGCDLWGERFF